MGVIGGKSVWKMGRLSLMRSTGPPQSGQWSSGTRMVSVTVSVGAAVLQPSDGHEDPAGALVREADQRLYEAKDAGRNRVAA